MPNTIHIDVVSAEESIYSGEAEFVVLPGEAGELGIYPRHTPLITRIKPGAVRILPAGGGPDAARGSGHQRNPAIQRRHSDSFPPWARRRNSTRVFESSRKMPRSALVTVREFCFSTPRIIMHRW